jgi:pseudomonalisin
VLTSKRFFFIVLAAPVILLILNLSTHSQAFAASADHTILAGNHPDEAETLPSLGNADLGQPLAMEIHFAIRNSAELDQLLSDQQDRFSPNFRKWLKTGEFEKRFGARDADIKAVSNWLRGEGFTVESHSTRAIKFSGDVDHAQRSFAVRIARFGDGSAYANVDDPSVATQFASVIAAISGLDNMGHVFPAGLHQIPLVGSSLPLAIIGGNEAFGPQDMRTFYDETVGPGSDGTGSCIAIISQGDVSADAQSVFDDQFGLPAMNVSKVFQSANPGVNGFSTETELDLDWTHAMAPGADLKLFIGDNKSQQSNVIFLDNFADAVNDNTCGAIDMSFILSGATRSQMLVVYDRATKQAAAQGQSIFVSSGDFGAAFYTLQGTPGDTRGVNELAADPFVTGVGGTQFTPTYDQSGNDVGYSVEEAWTASDILNGATGGGVSEFFAKPSYQTGPGVPDDKNRDVPDIALMGGLPGVFTGDATNGPAQISCCEHGTSVGAPMMAGLITVLGQQLGQRFGNMNQVFYPLARQQYGPEAVNNGFHDITTGNNNYFNVVGFNAGPAYDQCTGWGSIDFDVFAGAVKSSASPPPNPTTSMLPSPKKISFGKVHENSSSKAHKLSIVNKGTVDAMVGSVNVPTQFAIVSGTDLCSGHIVSPEKSCTVMMEFSPSVSGAITGSLSIPYNGGAATVSLSGTGTTPR